MVLVVGCLGFMAVFCSFVLVFFVWFFLYTSCIHRVAPFSWHSFI